MKKVLCINCLIGFLELSIDVDLNWKYKCPHCGFWRYLSCIEWSEECQK